MPGDDFIDQFHKDFTSRVVLSPLKNYVMYLLELNSHLQESGVFDDPPWDDYSCVFRKCQTFLGGNS